MAQVNEPLTWQSLERWTAEKLQKLLGFPPDEIVRYIFAAQSNSDVDSYLVDLLGNTKKTRSFIEQLTKKINSLPRRILKPVEKPKTNQSNNKKNDKQGRKETTVSTKKSIQSFSEIEIQGRSGDPCDCQATRHALVTNCLNCGKIVCDQEGKGPCKFCGTPLFHKPSNNGSSTASATQQQQQQKDRDLANAIQYKETILGYQKNSVQRTIVYDDQEDYFSNQNNKWISAEERNTIAAQEAAYNQQLEKEKRANRISIDIVGGRIVAASARDIKVDKLDLKPSSTSVTGNSTNTLEDLVSKDKIEAKYTHQHLKGKMSKQPKDTAGKKSGKDKDSKDDANTTKLIAKKSAANSIVQQYYGAEEDLLVLNSKDIKSNRIQFKGIMEGLWYNGPQQKRLPSINVYMNYLDQLKHKDSNYFIISPDNYSAETSKLEVPTPAPIPNSTVQFIKKLVEFAKTKSITINVAITLQKDFIFSQPESLVAMSGRLSSYKQLGVNDFSIVLPSHFNEVLAAPICAPNSAVAETNTAKAYSSAQVTFINELIAQLKPNALFICPSFFEIDLRVAPTRQQIEYWREISKGLDQKCSLLFSTPSGRLDDYLLTKIQNIFDKRRLIGIEKFPYQSNVRHNNNNNSRLNLDPYNSSFSQELSNVKLAGVMASPFDCQFHMDDLETLIPMTTFIQFLQSPSTYSAELTLRANLLEMMGNDHLAEAFADIIVALSNGVLEQLSENQMSTNLDDRSKLFMSLLIEKSKHVADFFYSQNNIGFAQKLENIIQILTPYSSTTTTSTTSS